MLLEHTLGRPDSDTSTHSDFSFGPGVPIVLSSNFFIPNQNTCV